MRNGSGRHGAGRHEMRTSNSDRLTVTASEQLLDGGDGPADLRRLLAAAAGPGTAKELAGEAAALAAFADAPRASSLPSAPNRRPSMLSSILSKLVAAKALAAVVLVAGATGGVALAATVSSGSDSPPADPPAATRTETPAATRAPGAGGADGSGHAAEHRPDDRATGRPEATPTADPDPSMTGLCTAWAAGATDDHGRAAENPAFRALVDAAGSAEDVDDYCAATTADRHDGRHDGRQNEQQDGRREGAEHSGRPTDVPGADHGSATPTTAPGNPDHPTGRPTAAPGNPDHPTGSSAEDRRQADTPGSTQVGAGSADREHGGE